MRLNNYYEKPSICAKCKGVCCKGIPGACYPKDFSYNTDNIFQALKSGLYSIDSWEGSLDGKDKPYYCFYFIRPAIKGYEGSIYHPSWGGECIFLTSKGCKLPADKRPAECGLIEPKENGPCIGHNNAGKEESARRWDSYNPWLNSLIYPEEDKK